MTERSVIMVTGPTGRVGRQVVTQLSAAGAAVRALVRDPETAELPGDVETVRGDLSDPASVTAAPAGVDRVFLLWPFMTADGARPIVDAIARQARHVVFLSAMSADGSTFHGRIEDMIRRSGPAWTFVRPGGFAANTLEWASQIRADGVVRAPYGGARRSFVHEYDIAAVAVRALTGDDHIGASYALTGPQALSQIDQARIIGEIIGRPVRFEELSRDEAYRLRLEAGRPVEFIEGRPRALGGDRHRAGVGHHDGAPRHRRAGAHISRVGR